MNSRIKTGIKLLGNGNNVDLYSYINERGDDLVEQYVSQLKEQEESKLVNLFEFLLSMGTIKNNEKFKYLTGSKGIFEFKSGSHRILCFILDGLHPKSFVMTHGFKKDKGKTPKKEIDKAEIIKKSISELYLNKKLKVYK
jgi:Phage derived protein Gp49-like (DUF891)